jgi:hypothetical protein
VSESVIDTNTANQRVFRELPALSGQTAAVFRVKLESSELEGSLEGVLLEQASASLVQEPLEPDAALRSDNQH